MMAASVILKQPLPVGAENIPDFLKSLNRWVVWQAYPRGNGKLDKVPSHPSNGNKINALDSNNWLSFDQAYKAYQHKNLSGIGIVLSYEQPVQFENKTGCLVALDYDDASSFVSSIKEDWLALGKPYMEVSPSGNGIRMIGFSTKPLRGGNNGKGREMYAARRFVTITGHSTKGRIIDATQPLVEFEGKWFPPRALNSHVAGAKSSQGPDTAPSETRENVQRVMAMLDHISSDCSYEKWRNIVWAVLSTGWASRIEIARRWSKRVNKIERPTHIYEEAAFQQLIDSFKPDRGVTLGTLVHHATNGGWQGKLVEVKLDVPQYSEKGPPARGLLTPAEVKAIPSQPYRVKGLLPQRGIAAIYGESGSGKSFLVMDLVFSIASGQPSWFDMRLKQTPVVYVALEGRSGLSKRIKAWEAHHGCDAPDIALTWLDGLSIRDKESRQVLSSEIIKHTGNGSVVVIDTLNQASDGADENSSVDMGHILANAKRLSDAIDGLVILVHHTGKDKSRGLRGHSSLFAAMDAVIEVSGLDSYKSWKVTKAKDDQLGSSNPFGLKIYTVGQDEDGEAITSCAIEIVSSSAIAPKPVKGKNQMACLAVIRKMCIAQPEGVDQALAIHRCSEVLECAEGRRKTVARETVNRLISSGHIYSEGGLLHVK